MSFNEERFIKGYIYDYKGYHTPPIYLKNEPKNIAKFIVRAFDIPKIQIVNSSDFTEMLIFGELVAVCEDKAYYMNELLPILKSMKVGTEDAFEGDIEFNYEGQVSKEEFIKWVKEKFNYIL